MILLIYHFQNLKQTILNDVLSIVVQYAVEQSSFWGEKGIFALPI